jgi:hypothetical protein
VVELGLRHGDVHFGAFVEVKCIFSTVLEANRGHWCDQTLNRMRSRHDQTCSVSAPCGRVVLVM